MNGPTEAQRQSRMWVPFIIPVLWTAVAVIWITWGISKHDPLRIGMATVWIAFAVVWSVRAVRGYQHRRPSALDRLSDERP